MSFLKSIFRSSEDESIKKELERNEPMTTFDPSPYASDREDTATFVTDNDDIVKVDRITRRITIKR